MESEFLAIDVQGWISQNRGRNPWELFREVLQNSMDAVEEQGSEIHVQFNSRKREIVVKDDGPGYSELQHAWTVYGGDKGEDPTKRGRFSRGIKETVAGVEFISVKTTSGYVEFHVDHENEDYRREVDEDVTTEQGTEVTMRNSEWELEEYTEMREYVNELWVPEGMEITVDVAGGSRKDKKHTEPIATYKTSLPTVVVKDGVMDETYRTCEVQVRHMISSGDGTVFEMGIPVGEWEGKYDVNVTQRVPMAEQRNEPDSGFMRSFRRKFVENMLGEITDGELRNDWVVKAIDSAVVDDDIKEEWVSRVMGDKVVISSDEKSDDKCKQRGYDVVDTNTMGLSKRSVVKDVVQEASEVHSEITKRQEEQIPMTQEQEEWVNGMLEMVDGIVDTSELSVEMWELGIDPTGNMTKADANRHAKVIRLNANADSWEESTPEAVGTFVHELAHMKCNGHSLKWASEMQRIFSEVLVQEME